MPNTVYWMPDNLTPETLKPEPHLFANFHEKWGYSQKNRFIFVNLNY
jgi:hypothetical protein